MAEPDPIRIGRVVAYVLYGLGGLCCVYCAAGAIGSYQILPRNIQDAYIAIMPFVAASIPCCLVVAVLFHLLAQIASSLWQLATRHQSGSSEYAAKRSSPQASR